MLQYFFNLKPPPMLEKPHGSSCNSLWASASEGTMLCIVGGIISRSRLAYGIAAILSHTNILKFKPSTMMRHEGIIMFFDCHHMHRVGTDLNVFFIMRKLVQW